MTPTRPIGHHLLYRLAAMQARVTWPLAIAFAIAGMLGGLFTPWDRSGVASALLLGAFFALPLGVIVAVVDRRRWALQDLLTFVMASGVVDWRRHTRSSLPLTRRAARRWLASPAATEVSPTMRAAALLLDWRIDDAMALLDQVPDDAPAGELADREAVRAQATFLRTGRLELARWEPAAAQLSRDEARPHRAMMAILEAAERLGRNVPWDGPVDRAWRELRPLAVPPALAAYKWVVRLAVPVGVPLVVFLIGLLALGVGLNDPLP